jgi:hypothetical protein
MLDCEHAVPPAIAEAGNMKRQAARNAHRQRSLLSEGRKVADRAISLSRILPPG